MTSRRTGGPAVVGLLAAPSVLAAVAPDPAGAWRALSQPSTDPTAPVVALVALLAWVLAAYLVAGGLLVLAGRLPGLAGRCAGAVAARTVPAAVRRGLTVALGTTLTLGTAATGPAAAGAHDGPARAGTPTAGLVVGAASTAPSLDWPTAAAAPAAPAAPAAAPLASAPRATTVVQPGDSLWALAERDLRTSGRLASPAAVAAAWPTWWAANREAVGADPHLLLPGTELVAPPAP